MMGLLVFGLLAGSARAATRVVADDWLESADAAPEARRRASRWADALGLRMVQVLSTDPDDRFAETIAVFERAEPVSAEAFASPELALASLSAMVEDLVGASEPVASELRSLPSGERVVWAQWIVDDLAYECVLAPSGETASLIVAAVLASQVGSERAELDRIYAELEGVTAAMPSFSLPAWRWGALGLWLALAAGLHVLMLAFVDRDRDHRQAGMRATLILLPVVALGTLLARGLLLERELALTHAGTSVAGLLTWIGATGMCVAALHVLLAQRADRGVVRSAPTTGAFASGTYSTADMVRATIQKAALRDPAASSGAWARPRRPDASDSSVAPIGPYDTSESDRIIVDVDDRFPPARGS
ncbi:hypothetical protein ACNOYE_12615 [Nannocystaceae bacterium ST9]